jgi:hypothetical protein
VLIFTHSAFKPLLDIANNINKTILLIQLSLLYAQYPQIALTWHKGQSAKRISPLDGNEMTDTSFLMQKHEAEIECRA